jgi:polysaccharide export outer membrane protein
MVKHLAPMVLVLLAACGNVSGRPPKEDTEFDPKGFMDEPMTGSGIPEVPQGQGFPLYPDDEVRFAVMGHPDLSFDAKVPAEGTIQYPMIGQVQLSGRSLEDVRAEIKSRLEKDYLVAPQVSVQIRTYAPKRVYVLGAVAHPREYEIASGKFSTLLQAVAQAGGFLEDAARHSVVIYRATEFGSSQKVSYSVDLTGLEAGRGTDPVLLPNDVVFVPSREKVYVYGQVTRPGAFSVPANQKLTATQAVALAGGFTRIANDGNVRLSRRMKTGRQTFILDLTKAQEGNETENVPLQPGDVLFVPESVF